MNTVAGASTSVRATLGRYGLVEVLGPDHIFDTADDAVTAFQRSVSSEPG